MGLRQSNKLPHPYLLICFRHTVAKNRGNKSGEHFLPLTHNQMATTIGTSHVANKEHKRAAESSVAFANYKWDGLERNLTLIKSHFCLTLSSLGRPQILPMAEEIVPIFRFNFPSH